MLETTPLLVSQLEVYYKVHRLRQYSSEASLLKKVDKLYELDVFWSDIASP